GGVNMLDLYNQAGAGISAGAKVNQRGFPTSATQDIVIDADATIQLALLAGLDSAINFDDNGAPGTAIAVGGYFNGLFADNYATAYIDDRADVAAAPHVAIHSPPQTTPSSAVTPGP